MRWNADWPGVAVAFCRPAREIRIVLNLKIIEHESMESLRVLMVSIGAFEKGPMAPEIRPMHICWYEGNSTRSGCRLCASFLISWYAVKFAPIPWQKSENFK